MMVVDLSYKHLPPSSICAMRKDKIILNCFCDLVVAI